MFKKLIPAIFVLIVLLLIGAGAYFSFRHPKIETPASPISQNILESVQKKETELQAVPIQPEFVISGWIPYWAKENGIASLKGHRQLFDELNPFAIHIKSDGSFIDDLHLAATPWKSLREEAEKTQTTIIPTLLWTDAKAMHAVFSDATNAQKQRENIIKFLEEGNFSGVDIDYEGKDIADRDLFSLYVEKLSENLHEKGKTLRCTVEARADDTVPTGWSGTKAMSYANDWEILGRTCDEVRIMAYDEPFQVHRVDSFEEKGEHPTQPNADIRWVEKVVDHALQSIEPQKIMLGIPTYGWEYVVTPIKGGFRYKRYQSLTYVQAIVLAKKSTKTPIRDESGELAFTYGALDGVHLVTLSDAKSIEQKLSFAKEKHLKGASLFKLDGEFDLDLLSSLEKLKK